MTEDDLQADNLAEESNDDIDMGNASESLDNAEKMYNSKQVTAVVKREQQKAFERGRKLAMEELQRQQAQNMPQAQQAQNLGGMQQMSEDDIRRLIAEQTPQVLQEHAQQFKINQTVDSFVNKMKAAEERYPGLESKLNELDFQHLAPVIQSANELENTADIMQELLENPMKMGNLVMLMHTQPKLAQKAMFDLSNSIKTNQQALQEKELARDPLSQINPKSKAGIDNSTMTVSDFRKMFKR